MKIALVSPYDFPYPGGVTEHISALDQHFRALGHDTRVIAASTAHPDELGAHVIKISGTLAPITVGGATARVTYSPQVYQRAKRILRAEKFDIVHIHEPTIPMLSVAVLRHSHSINVGTFHAYRDSLATYDMMRPLLSHLFQRLDGRIYVSPAARDFVTRYFPGPAVIIPNGIEYNRFASPRIEPIEQFSDPRPNILFVGRMDERKGFRHLLRAFSRIKSQIPDARLIVVGAFSASETEPNRRYARAQGLRDVHFIGRVSPAELPRYYRAATLFVAPSTGAESFGIVLLEALASGAPIIASDILGYRGVLESEHAGALVAPGDEQAIADAAIPLLRDRARREQMSAQGKHLAAKYDWDIVARRVLDYYEVLVAARQAERVRKPLAADPHIVRHLVHWGRLRRSLRVMGLL